MAGGLDPGAVRPATAADVTGLARLLLACIVDGASVGWVNPPDLGELEEWWRTWLSSGAEVLVLEDAGGQVATVSLLRASSENGRHRGEVAKLLVSPSLRRRGAATTLMRAVQDLAARRGLCTLLLDTESGSAAQRLYEGLGWEVVGVVPDYWERRDGSLQATTFLTLRLPPGPEE